jgi:ABC-2 type transport system ATP-binding protein
LPLKKKAGQLSGGEQAQLSLVLALAKRPELLLLDEPIAGFDPLARSDFLQLLVETVAENGTAVLLSSHILGDLERVCDSLMILIGGRVRLSETIERVLESHRVIIGPVDQEMLVSCVHSVIDRSRTEKQVATLAKLDAPLVLTDLWTVHEPSLEEIVLGYMQGRDGCTPVLSERKAV